MDAVLVRAAGNYAFPMFCDWRSDIHFRRGWIAETSDGAAGLRCF
ncbi:hypothetical protein [Tabrizicola sp. BL-A-41-H6]